MIGSSSHASPARFWPARFPLLIALALACALPILRADVVLDWNAVMMAGVRTDSTGPTLSTRNLAILHIAMYDAINSVLRTHQPYLVALDGFPGASPEAAASAAGYTVLNILYPTLRARTEDLYETWRASAPSNSATTNGIRLGTAVAQQILAARSDDGSATEVPYIPSENPGEWRRTSPFFRPPLTPHWRYVDLFALTDLERFVPPPPPALNSPEYAEELNEVKAIGGKGSSVRTAEQTEIAVFWSDFSYTAMPPGHWHEIAASIARTRASSLPETARLMALLSVAQADAAILCWEAKFRYNRWRPITAIQRADEDGNPETISDPAWDHLLAAPPFPAYTSGHSTFSKASAQVLARFYGTDAISFTAASDSIPGVFRSFSSLAACADEIGLSRIYGGIHFQSDNIAGKRCGQEIADFVMANLLLDNASLPLVRLERITERSVQLRVHAHADRLAVLQTSADLANWTSASTNLAARGGALVSLDNPDRQKLFFRAVELQ